MVPFGLAQNPQVGVFGELGMQQFESDLAVEPRIVCMPDISHPARADFVNDAIVRDFLDDHCVCSLYRLLSDLIGQRYNEFDAA